VRAVVTEADLVELIASQTNLEQLDVWRLGGAVSAGKRIPLRRILMMLSGLPGSGGAIEVMPRTNNQIRAAGLVLRRAA
jgi:hypothetical protein